MVELLLAVAIIGILASSVVFVLNPGKQLAKSRDAQRKSDLEQIKNALDAYYSDNNVFPSAIDGKISGIAWGGTWDSYMSKVPHDPISSQSYLYEAAADGSWYRLYAKLERCADSQSNLGVDCLREYSYSVNSSNLAALALIPTPTLVPPTPTPTIVPTSTPTAGQKSSPCFPYGDVDLDGWISNSDSLTISKSLTRSITLSQQQKNNGDVNGSGALTIADASLINQYLAGRRTTFPICSMTPTP